ncbi:MAG: lipopolysaccharide kinase InaA family protein, partial [Planctomycetota bacterium]
MTIKQTRADDEALSVTCVGLLRSVGGKRQVYDALWGNRPVILKAFSDRIKAKYHMNREWRGLELLLQRGLNSPTPLFKGRSERLGWVVVTEKITNAMNVREAWDKTRDVNEMRDLLPKVARELAKQHNKGVLQKDLHLGNLMIRQDKIFALDPAQMRFLSREVGKRRAIAQLGLLASTLSSTENDMLADVCEVYMQVRSWKLSAPDIAAISRKAARCRRKGITRALRKCLRTSSRYQRLNTYNHRGVAIREFFEKVDFGALAGSIDKGMQGGHVLKNGNTCRVSHVGLGGEEVVIKRYNHKGIIHSLRHTIKGSRARRGWLHANRLTLLNIATPKPLAYLEHRIGPIVWKSYLITEYVEGQSLYHFLRDDAKSQQERARLNEQLRKLVEELGRHHITHGDLKHTNILVTANGPVLTDLD